MTKFTGRMMALAAAGLIAVGTAGIDASAAPTRGTQAGATAQPGQARTTTPAPAPTAGRQAPANPVLGQPAPAPAPAPAPTPTAGQTVVANPVPGQTAPVR